MSNINCYREQSGKDGKSWINKNHGVRREPNMKEEEEKKKKNEKKQASKRKERLHTGMKRNETEKK